VPSSAARGRQAHRSVAIGLAFAGLVASRRSPRIRDGLLATYASPTLPFLLRTAPIGAWPAWALGGLLLGAMSVLPAGWAIWLLIPFFGLLSLGLIWSYRRPPRFLDPWIAETAVERGLSVPHPSRTDWILFWFLQTLIVLGGLSVLLAIVAFRYPK
jgi:hypothetical protein